MIKIKFSKLYPTNTVCLQKSQSTYQSMWLYLIVALLKSYILKHLNKTTRIFLYKTITGLILGRSNPLFFPQLFISFFIPFTEDQVSIKLQYTKGLLKK